MVQELASESPCYYGVLSPNSSLGPKFITVDLRNLERATDPYDFMNEYDVMDFLAKAFNWKHLRDMWTEYVSECVTDPALRENYVDNILRLTKSLRMMSEPKDIISFAHSKIILTHVPL
jgi:hypothetical protein